MPLLPGAIVVDDDLTPSRFLSLDWSILGGVALERGSPSSHVAMLARARGVPMATNLGEAPESGEAVLDAEAGLLVVRPDPATRERYARRLDERRPEHAEATALLARPAVTAAGERVEVMLNVDDPGAVSDDLLDAADGVGLLRTEFLFIGRERLPDEVEQFAAYTALLDRLRGKPCIVRTLDVGGDKALPGVSLPEESNPFLGLRGLRLCLDRPELFRPQVRALLRAAVGRAAQGDAADGGDGGRARRRRARSSPPASRSFAPRGPRPRCRRSASWSRRRPPPSPIDLIPADFFSIGSNDLTQYVMAASRDAGGRVAALNDPLHPAVLRLIGQVVRHGEATGDAGQPVRRHGLRSDGRRRPARASACAGSRWHRPPWAGSSSPWRGSARAMPEREDRQPGRDHRRLQGAAALVPRAPPVRPARPARHGAGQAQELRLADRQPGLHRADPGRRPADHLRDLPPLAAGARGLPRPLPPRPPRALAAPRRRPGRAATSCASPCPSSARPTTAREVEALILDLSARIIRLAQHAEAAHDEGGTEP